MQTFWTTFALIFVNELGDKSRVVGLLLATTYRRPWPVFLGMTVGYALLQGVAIALGSSVRFVIDREWLETMTGALFLTLGATSLLFADEAEAHTKRWLARVEKWGPFAVSALATGLSEIGDRTQLAAAGISMQTGSPWAVFAGAMAALSALNALTVALGERLANLFTARSIHTAGGVLFLAFGAYLLYHGLFLR